MLAVLVLVVSGFLVVPVPAAQAAEPCNPNVANWPDCLPSLAQLRDAVRSPENGAFFWTGGSLAQAAAIADSEGGTTLEQALDQADLALPQMDTPRSPEGDQAWQRASRMLAEQARGIAYVVIGNPPRPNNVWSSDEEPTLRANPAVRCIVEINARTGDERVIYARGDNQEIVMRQCEADRAVQQARRVCRAWEQEGFPHLAPGVNTTIGSPRLPLLPWREEGEVLTGGSLEPDEFSFVGTTYRYGVDPNPAPSPSVSPAEIDAQVTAGPHMDVSFRSTTDRLPDTITVWNPGHTYSRYFPDVEVLGCTPVGRDELRKRDLRVMPAGSSTSYGDNSPDGNGYRKVLDEGLQELVEEKDPEGAQGADDGAGTVKAADGQDATPRVDQVGSVRVGTMADRDNEGWSGYTIDTISGKLNCSVPVYKPNLVTLIAGGNNVIKDYQMETALSQLEDLVKQVQEDSPAATVLVGDMQRLRDPAADARAVAFSESIPAMVERLAAEGRHVIFVDTELTPGDISDDGVHPTGEGYAKVGRAFVDATRSAFDRGWIEPAEPKAEGADSEKPPCGIKDGGDGVDDDDDGGGGGTTQLDDARWEDHGVSFKDGFGTGNSYHWGHVNKDGRPELFVVEPDQSWTFYWNNGRTDKGWKGWGKGFTRAAPGGGRVGNALRFADIDGDGLTDCVRVDLTGGISVSTWDETKPVGQKLCGTPYEGDKVADGPIKADTRIVFADLDGDERDDYLLIQPRGTTELWLNRKGGWIEGGQIAGPLGDARIRRWADIDKNGRADQILVTAKGGARAWLNEGISQNQDGTLEVKLRDVGAILKDTGLPPADMRFVDVGGDGNADLARVGHTGVTHIWLNRLGLKPAATTDGPIRDPSQDRRWEDHGVSFERGFGPGKSYQWGDVNDDGRDELFVIDPDQGWTFYWNNGRTDDGWTDWTKGVSRPARQPGLVGNTLRIADMDGDDLPDCITVDLSGRLTSVLVWDDSKPAGEKICGRPIKGDADVPDTGPIDPGTQIIFAEMDGNPGTDYLLVEPRGTTRLWFNLNNRTGNGGFVGDTWREVGQIAGPLGDARIRRWADIDGDNQADQILITPGGGARAWLNKGKIIDPESVGPGLLPKPVGVKLVDIGEIAKDKDVPPADVRFADVGGDGRADFVRIGHTGVTRIWLNRLTDQDLE